MAEICVKNLIKSFGELTAVDIPDFVVHHGELLGLVGNNGAGKTTLFRLMLDLLNPGQGQISISFNKGNDQRSTTPIIYNIGETDGWKAYTGAYLDEGFLIDFLTPEEYFEFISKVNEEGRWQDNLSDAMVALMNGEIIGKGKYIRDFSSGNKQKIGIIAALLHKPQLLILDEPFNYLDPSGQIRLMRLLTEYNHSTGATILISSHNIQHTIEICPRIALMEHGHIIKDLCNHDKSAEKELKSYFDI